MAKKVPAPASEAPAAAATSADPTLLGVGLPVKVTVDAAKTVFAAWKDSLLALKSAIEEKLKKKETPAEAAPANEAPVVTA